MNKNTILALAYIKENTNPLHVFCNLITYCLYVTPEKSLRHDQLRESVYEKFGLKLPHHLINTCIRILKKGNNVESLANGAGYGLLKANLDITKFESDTKYLKEKEEQLLNNMINFINTSYGKEWTIDNAIDYLTKYLVANENAYYLFVNGQAFDIEEEHKKYISPSWYISKYINMLREKKNSDYDYLVEVVHGLLVYIGITQVDDYSRDKQQKFYGTEFYIDTKLVLRAMGFSWTALVEGTRELLDLIVKEYGGKICIFEHTLKEVEFALGSASENLKRNGNVENAELRAFKLLNNFDHYNFYIEAKSARNKIEEVFKYEIKPCTEWNNSETRLYNIDWEHMHEFIKHQHATWKDAAIKNDICSINQINILRKGNYKIKYGGKNRLPIFLTTNYPLIRDIKNYIKENRAEVGQEEDWDMYNLPLISDTLLMCRLWLPMANNYSNLPVLALSRTVYTAQQADIVFYERLKKTAKDIEAKHKFSVMDLSAERSEQLMDIMIRKSGGDVDIVDSELVALSVEELIKYETAAKDEEIGILQVTTLQKDKLIEAQKSTIINLYSKKYINKVGLINLLLLFLAKYWWALSAVFIVLVTSVISLLKSNKIITQYSIIVFIFSVLSPYIMKVLDRYSNSKKVITTIQEKFQRMAKDNFSKSIQKRMSQEEKEYEEDIIQMCLQNTEAFKIA